MPLTTAWRKRKELEQELETLKDSFSVLQKSESELKRQLEILQTSETSMKQVKAKNETELKHALEKISCLETSLNSKSGLFAGAFAYGIYSFSELFNLKN